MNHPASTDSTALVVVDMQRVFASPDSEWHVRGYEGAAAHVTRLVAQFSGPVVWTKFVRDPDERGSWGAYYDRWSGCREEPGSPAWDLTLPTAESHEVLALPTFSKWGAELAALTGDADQLIVCGVATDCCVLSTVLGAVDAGKAVTVVTDACAGITDTAHEQAIALMQLLSPMVTLATTAQLVGGSAQRRGAESAQASAESP
ncbi:cysteine hydrolase family protein [Ruicaihuangia caeni]|uniref:Cysteine hydrolase n=1 Tax=Ruicaihuangia caeni TaxID=3042517 RepID=A0AAW6T3G5_9MICO|nr:cysteine hydrolase [Klugiella sp. YN-L-19]MDI2098287.1 cysteine hydrolase [Klugiella sp. YN-L-19]